MAVVNIARCQLKLRQISILCAVAGIAVYLGTLDCGFCYDDKSAILENRDVTGESSSWQLLWNDFWGHPIHLNTSHKSYRPLCVATFRLNYLLHELEPMGYHLVNVLLHGAVCYLYVQLCGVVFSGAVWPALIAGLLFAVHPIHTEAVSLIASHPIHAMKHPIYGCTLLYRLLGLLAELIYWRRFSVLFRFSLTTKASPTLPPQWVSYYVTFSLPIHLLRKRERLTHTQTRFETVCNHQGKLSWLILWCGLVRFRGGHCTSFLGRLWW
jgi:hypothetical protein